MDNPLENIILLPNLFWQNLFVPSIALGNTLFFLFVFAQKIFWPIFGRARQVILLGPTAEGCIPRLYAQVTGELASGDGGQAVD